MLPASPKARAVFSSTVFAGKTLQWGEKNRPKKLMRFCETKNARQKEKRLLLSSFSSSSRGGRGRRRRGMSYLSTLPTSSSASAASASSSSSSSSSARFAFSRTTHQNRKSTIKAAFSNRQRREKTAAVVVARGCGKAESDGSGTREVNRAKDDDEASSGASRRENAREENDEEEEDAFQRHDTSPFPESRDERPKRENALSSIGRRTVMSSAAFGAMTSSSTSITLLSFPDKAKATPRDIEWAR